MRTVSGGSVKEAATAAPIDDPGSERIELPSKSRRSNDPCYKNKNVKGSRCAENDHRMGIQKK